MMASRSLLLRSRPSLAPALRRHSAMPIMGALRVGHQRAQLPALSPPGTYSGWRGMSKGVIKVEVPSMGESVVDGQLGAFAKGEGDYVESEEEIVQIETDKITHGLYSLEAGKITKVHFKEGDTVKIGDVVLEVDTSAAKQDKKEPKKEEKKEEKKEDKKEEKKEEKQPQKEEKREEKKEEKREEKREEKKESEPKKEVKKEESKEVKKSESKSSSPTPSFSSEVSRNTRRVPMSRMRQRIAGRLKEAQNTAAMLTTFNEIDMSNVIALRNQHKDLFLDKHGVKLGFMSLFTKAAVVALKSQPAVNAYIDGTDVVYNDFVDVSIAVATPTGLVVPVIRNCESLSIAGIEKTIASLGERARNGNLKVEDMTGGTFTISNGGVFGSLFGTPIINPPQSAILGMHATKDRPVAVNGKVEVRPMMYVALTYDHRLIDGREAVLALRTIKEVIEDPARLLFE